MAKFSKVKAADAPKPTKQTGRLAARMREYETYVTGLGAGEVGKLVPDRDESARGIALRIGRAATRAGKKADTWVVDGTVYFRVA